MFLSFVSRIFSHSFFFILKMSSSGFDEDKSLVVRWKSMLEKEILDMGEESKSFSDSIASLPLSDEEEFQNLMKGPEIFYGVNVIVIDIVSGDINTGLVDSNREGSKVDIFEPFRKMDEAIGGGNGEGSGYCRVFP